MVVGNPNHNLTSYDSLSTAIITNYQSITMVAWTDNAYYMQGILCLPSGLPGRLCCFCCFRGFCGLVGMVGVVGWLLFVFSHSAVDYR